MVYIHTVCDATFFLHINFWTSAEITTPTCKIAITETEYLDFRHSLYFWGLHGFYCDLQLSFLLVAGLDWSGGLGLVERGHGDPCLSQSSLGEDWRTDRTGAPLCAHHWTQYRPNGNVNKRKYVLWRDGILCTFDMLKSSQVSKMQLKQL